MTAALAALATVTAGCGGSDGGRTTLDVGAASSLKRPLGMLAGSDRKVDLRLEFAGSDAIAAAIRSGRRPDVAILAGSAIPLALAKDGLASSPVPIAANRLVVAVRKDGARPSGIEDLARPGLRVALGSPNVPIGSYADGVLARLPEATRRAILGNVATREPDAASLVGKLRSGAVDAAIIYRTDVTAAGRSLEAVAIPDRLGPSTVYEAVIVKGTRHPAEARGLIASLEAGEGRRALAENGFLPAGR